MPKDTGQILEWCTSVKQLHFRWKNTATGLFYSSWKQLQCWWENRIMHATLEPRSLDHRTNLCLLILLSWIFLLLGHGTPTKRMTGGTFLGFFRRCGSCSWCATFITIQRWPTSSTLTAFSHSNGSRDLKFLGFALRLWGQCVSFRRRITAWLV